MRDEPKLDDVLPTSLAIGVIIGTVARALGPETSFGHSAFLIPAVFSFAASVLIAVVSRNPVSFTTPLKIRNLLKVMDDHRELSTGKTKGVIASSYHVANVGTYATNNWKGTQLRRASGFLVLGIVLLIAMLITPPAPAASKVGDDQPEQHNRPAVDAAQRTRPDSFFAQYYSG